jgi:hypothetical protein
VLESPDSEKSVEAGTEPTFPVVMWSQAQENASIRIRLDTVAGAQWRTALCIQELCLIHDGESELDEVLELDLEEKTDLEVKMLVPQDAQPGDTKTVLLELSVVGGAGKPGSISLKGTMP